MSPMKGVCKLLLGDILNVMLWVPNNKVHGSLFIVSAPLSLVLLWFVQPIVALPKVIHHPYLVSRDDAYMTVIGTMQWMHQITIVMILKASLATYSILLNL